MMKYLVRISLFFCMSHINHIITRHFPSFICDIQHGAPRGPNSAQSGSHPSQFPRALTQAAYGTSEKRVARNTSQTRHICANHRCCRRRQHDTDKQCKYYLAYFLII